MFSIDYLKHDRLINLCIYLNVYGLKTKIVCRSYFSEAAKYFAGYSARSEKLLQGKMQFLNCLRSAVYVY